MTFPSATPAPSRPTLHGNYVLLRADNLRLLLPQHEVGSLAYLETAPDAGDLPGQFLFRNDERLAHSRFVALSEKMRLMPDFPVERFVYTTLGHEEDDLLCWCWSQVQILPESEISPQYLPPVLRSPGSPITRFTELRGKVVFLCNARQLRQYALDLPN